MIKELFVDYFSTSIKQNWNLVAMQDYENPQKAITYAELGNEILKLHALYKMCGLEKGDKIVLVGKNSVNWACVYLSATTYGAVIVPLLQDFTSEDIYTLTNHSDAKIAFVSADILKRIDVQKFSYLNEIFKLDDFTSYFTCNGNAHLIDSYAYLVSQDEFSLPQIGNDQLGVILYTSGTSGKPKGVMLQLNSLAANIRYARSKIQLQQKDKIVSLLPLAHCYGCAFDLLFPLTCGCNIVFLGKLPSPQVILKAFSEHKPRLILLVPLVIEKIYKSKILPKLEKPLLKVLTHMPVVKHLIFNKMRKMLVEAFGGNFIQIILGGAKMNRDVEMFLKSIKFPFTVGYGMTECGPLVSYCNWREHKQFCSGQLVDMLEVKVNANAGKVGEIFLRGENVMVGYYKNQEETDKALDSDGWLHTGDLGVVDGDNFIALKGRSKTMILTSSGQNVYPEEIEQRLCNFPIISECVVVSRSAKIVSIIYPNPELSKKMTQEEIEQQLSECRQKVNLQIPNYMHISKIQVRNEEFEKTPKKSIKRYLYE